MVLNATPFVVASVHTCDRKTLTAKIWKIMRLMAIFLFAVCIGAAARTNGQTVTFSGKNVPLTKLFSVIKEQTGYVFFYDQSLLQNAKPITLEVKDAPLENVLQQTFSQQPFSFSIVNKTITIVAKPATPPVTLSNVEMRPPPVDIRGKIVNEANEGISATVTIKGTSTAVATDANGNFELKNIDESSSLLITAISISPLEIKTSTILSLMASGSGIAIITTKTKITALNEVIINKGYYTEKQKYSVGNVATITSKDIENQPVMNPLLALQGRVTGIEITQLTGLNGGAIKVRVQGQNSINAGLDPLIVVDGVPFPSNLSNVNGIDNLVQGGSALNYINPNDIESITVLKDADATSIYGSRAANGAILITTKRGKAGKAKLSVSIQQGWGKVSRRIDMMNTRQYLDMRYEAFRNDNQIPSNNPNASWAYAPDLTLWDTTRYTDWQKELIGGTAKYTNVNASISGGNDAVQYLIGATYRRQTTVFPGDFDDKIGGLHFNITSNSSNKRLSVQFSGSYMYDNNHLPGLDMTSRALFLVPNAPKLFKPDGTLNWEQDASGKSTWSNPLATIYGRDYNKTAKNLISNLNLNYIILPGFTIGSSMGYSNVQGNNYSPSRLEAEAPEARATSVRSAVFGKQDISNWIIEPQLKYANKIGNGFIEGLFGSSFQKRNSDILYINASGFVDDQLMNSPASAPTKTIASSSSIYKYNAFFFRFNYNWKEKYIINITGRRDGSSRFGDNNKFHNFSSAGAAWIFSEEKFLEQNLPILSFGKLRGSYGTTGNDGIGDYIYLSTYRSSIPAIPYQGGTGLSVNQIPNPNLQWEETRKLQAGIDLGFFKDRVLLGATYSRNQSSNQLIFSSLPTITGYNLIQENFPATIRNTSWEFTLHTDIFKRKDFSWAIDFNLTIPKNKLVSFPDIEKTSYADGTSGVIVGQPLGIIKTYNYGGVDPANGFYYPLDRNGNPVYYPNFPTSLDQTAIVSTLSKYYGGLINTITYKGFQFEFVFQFVRQSGADDFDFWNGSAYPGFFTQSGNQPVSLLNKKRWQKPGDNAEIGYYSIDPNAIPMWPGGVSSNAAYSYTSSFVRLKNVSLNWQVPKAWTKKTGLQNAAFYFRGENLATITNYKSLDPETKSNGSLPPLQIWTIGTKLDF